MKKYLWSSSKENLMLRCSVPKHLESGHYNFSEPTWTYTRMQHSRIVDLIYCFSRCHTLAFMCYLCMLVISGFSFIWTLRGSQYNAGNENKQRGTSIRRRLVMNRVRLNIYNGLYYFLRGFTTHKTKWFCL